MSVTMQSVVDLARLDLNDSATTDAMRRNKDSDMIKFANDGVAKVLVMRCDLNFGNYATAYQDMALTDVFPLPLEYRPGIANYIVMRCESADDAFANEQRAIQGLTLFMKDLGMG